MRGLNLYIDVTIERKGGGEVYTCVTRERVTRQTDRERERERERERQTDRQTAGQRGKGWGG